MLNFLSLYIYNILRSDLNVNSFCIENVESHKILDVYVDKHLSWNFHIDKAVSKINSKITLLKRTAMYLTFKMQRLLYNSYILSIFDYCCTVWWKNTKCESTELTVLQKRIARIILGVTTRTPSKNLLFNVR